MSCKQINIWRSIEEKLVGNIHAWSSVPRTWTWTTLLILPGGGKSPPRKYVQKKVPCMIKAIKLVTNTWSAWASHGWEEQWVLWVWNSETVTNPHLLDPECQVLFSVGLGSSIITDPKKEKALRVSVSVSVSVWVLVGVYMERSRRHMYVFWSSMSPWLD